MRSSLVARSFSRRRRRDRCEAISSASPATDIATVSAQRGNGTPPQAAPAALAVHVASATTAAAEAIIASAAAPTPRAQAASSIRHSLPHHAGRVETL